MVSTNVDTADGLFNGAVGVLRNVEISGGKMIALYIEFDDPKVGMVARGLRKAIMEKKNFPKAWTPILRVKKVFNVLRGGVVNVIKKVFFFYELIINDI